MCSNNENISCCCIISIISSIIAAVGIAVVFYAGFLASILPLVYITLILGIIGILYIFISVICGGNTNCRTVKHLCLIPIAVGSIVSSVFVLALSTIPTLSITVGILIAAVAFFLLMSLINLINIILSLFCN